MQGNRDLIIITGPNATGKTTASNYLRSWFSLHGIAHESEPVADTQSLLEILRLDDKNGGFHHTHDWCKAGEKGHTHNPGQPEVPFMNIDNEIPKGMFQHFFTRLTSVPKTGKVRFVEWAGGINTNPAEELSSQPDYSYRSVKRMLQQRILPVDWIARVKAVVHLQATFDLRVSLNEQAQQGSLKEVEQGISSWILTETILRFFGQDDFFEIEDLLRNANVAIHTIVNDGGKGFFEKLDMVAPRLALK